MTPDVDLLKALTLGVGGLMSLTGAIARYAHNRLFKQHVNALADAEDGATAQEVHRFREDSRIDIAIHLMGLEPLGWVLLFIGFFLLTGQF